MCSDIKMTLAELRESMRFDNILMVARLFFLAHKDPDKDIAIMISNNGYRHR